jgi:hypothetical protein
MKITIDFEKKEIILEGSVNLQELFLKLADLNIDQSKYTLVQKQVNNTLPRLSIVTPKTFGQPYAPYSEIIGSKGLNNKIY